MVTKAHVCWRSHSHETHTERKREWEKKKFHWICHWLMNFGKEFKMKFTQIRTNFYRHITLYACSCVDVCLSISTKLMIQLKWMDGWLADWLTDWLLWHIFDWHPHSDDFSHFNCSWCWCCSCHNNTHKSLNTVSSVRELPANKQKWNVYTWIEWEKK